jgi:hypothetical protein
MCFDWPTRTWEILSDPDHVVLFFSPPFLWWRLSSTPLYYHLPVCAPSQPTDMHVEAEVSPSSFPSQGKEWLGVDDVKDGRWVDWIIGGGGALTEPSLSIPLQNLHYIINRAGRCHLGGSAPIIFAWRWAALGQCLSCESEGQFVGLPLCPYT